MQKEQTVLLAPDLPSSLLAQQQLPHNFLPRLRQPNSIVQKYRHHKSAIAMISTKPITLNVTASKRESKTLDFVPALFLLCARQKEMCSRFFDFLVDKCSVNGGNFLLIEWGSYHVKERKKS